MVQEDHGLVSNDDFGMRDDGGGPLWVVLDAGLGLDMWHWARPSV